MADIDFKEFDKEVIEEIKNRKKPKRKELFNILAKNFAPEEKVFVGYKNPFSSEGFTQYKIRLRALNNFINDLIHKGDTYICFTPIEGSKRLSEHAQSTYMVVIDIDGAKIPDDYFAPTYVWETSKGKYQGLWLFDNSLTPIEHKEILEYLVTIYNFDVTSKDIVHFFRVPCSYNYKYSSTFNVSNIKRKGKDNSFRKAEFLKKIRKKGIAPRQIQRTSRDIIQESEEDYQELVDNFGLADVINNTSQLDKSDYIFTVEQVAFREGLTKEQVKTLLLGLPVQKYKDSKLDREIHRAFQKFEEDKLPQVGFGHFGVRNLDNELVEPEEKPKKKSKKKKPIKPQGVSITQVCDIPDFDEADSWLIEGLWADKSVGVIGAPPKAFKSTLALNMAISVATGEDFDGRKVKQGPVLIMQAENNIGVEKKKIKQIAGTTNLPIYFVDDIITLDRIAKLRQVIIDYKIKLLMIDPLYLLFGAGDINKHGDTTTRLGALSRLRDGTDCSVMLIHHSRKLAHGARIRTSDLNGSMFIEAWYENMLLLQRSGVTTSTLYTYFRNHVSGDVYTVHVNDKLGVKVIKKEDETGFDNDDSKPQGGFSSMKKKEE